ncbi:MAG: hypothetical protein ABIQ51_04150 [Mesorhizobium sp.]
MPTLVEKPPEGDDWIHEINFDGYRSQIIFDHDVRIFTRNGLDWTAKSDHGVIIHALDISIVAMGQVCGRRRDIIDRRERPDCQSRKAAINSVA